MDVKTQTTPVFVVAKPVRKRRKSKRLPSQFEQIRSLAEKSGWNNQSDIKLFGKGKMIADQTTINGWILKPVNLYEQIIPPEAMQRVMELINAGIKIKGIVIADDERKYEVVPEPEQIPDEIPGITGEDVMRVAGRVLNGAMEVAGVGITVVSAIASLLLFDPILVVVLEDFKWVSLYTWYD